MKFAALRLYNILEELVERGTVKVKCTCLAQAHNTMFLSLLNALQKVLAMECAYAAAFTFTA